MNKEMKARIYEVIVNELNRCSQNKNEYLNSFDCVWWALKAKFGGLADELDFMGQIEALVRKGKLTLSTHKIDCGGTICFSLQLSLPK